MNKYSYVLYENIVLENEDTIMNWLFGHSILAETLTPFLAMDALEFHYSFKDDVCMVQVSLKETMSINIIDSRNAVRYLIPYDMSLSHDKYFRYFCILYPCEHANEISEYLPSNTFSEWIFTELIESPFKMIYKEHQDNIYAGTCLVMEPSVHIIPENFTYTLIQQMG